MKIWLTGMEPCRIPLRLVNGGPGGFQTDRVAYLSIRVPSVFSFTRWTCDRNPDPHRTAESRGAAAAPDLREALYSRLRFLTSLAGHQGDPKFWIVCGARGGGLWSCGSRGQDFFMSQD